MAPAAGTGGTPDPAQMFDQLLGTPARRLLRLSRLCRAGRHVCERQDQRRHRGDASTTRRSPASASTGCSGWPASAAPRARHNHRGDRPRRRDDHPDSRLARGGGMAQLPGSGSARFEVAVDKGRLYLGLDDFVTAALDRAASDSLAQTAGFKKALGDGGGDNAGVVYVDIAGLRGAIESTLPSDALSRYQADAAPFLAPLKTLAVRVPRRRRHRRQQRQSVRRVTFARLSQGGILNPVAVHIRLTRVGATKQPTLSLRRFRQPQRPRRTIARHHSGITTRAPIRSRSRSTRTRRATG